MLNLQRNASFDSEIEAVIMKERASEKERERERCRRRNESTVLWPGLWFQWERDTFAFPLKKRDRMSSFNTHTHTHTHTRRWIYTATHKCMHTHTHLVPSF